MTRLFGLDYLRGLAALSIMCFHYFAWTYGEPNAATILGRIGIYGVELFYILSGITLYMVYYNRMTIDRKGLTDFFKKRGLRIFPLFWLATISMVVLAAETPDLKKLFLNLTGLFSVFSWNDYYVPGAWSIGNELVFYLFFPVFVLLLRKSVVAFAVLAIIITGYYIYSAFFLLSVEAPLAPQWNKYTHPFNQVFLFLAGFAIAHNFRNVKISNVICVIMMAGGAALFLFIPADGDLITVVTGVNRMLFTLSCLMTCFGFYKLTYELKGDKPLHLLGEASYSVYLLHPIVFAVVGMITIKFRIWISIPLTLIGSYFVYELFEKRFMRMGKRS
jgi:exopolysaccharide production protein ExoZ